ncbi:MAG: CAP domain-containing protein [Lutibacter sp.]
MKPHSLLKIAILILLITTSSCAKEENVSTENLVTFKEVTYSELDNQVLDLVNNYRNEIGLTILNKLDIVSAVANTHTDYMVETGNVDHSGFDQRQKDLMENANAKAVGENVAYGYTNAQDVFDAWIKSDSHRALIESKSFTHFGISSEMNDKGRYYYTIMFIKK